MKQFIILLCIYSLFAEFTQATGPSSIQSNLHPVSINQRGEILCRTRFTQNDMGSHNLMKISYGYCIISNNSIFEFPDYELNPEEYLDKEELFITDRHWCDSIFYSNLNLHYNDSIINELNDKYHFVSDNVGGYKSNRFYTLAEFQSFKNKDLSLLKQKALRGGQSVSGEPVLNRMFVEYDFGNILILRNKTSYECLDDEHESDTDNCYGAAFDYYYPLLGANLEYEISDITGILFLNENNK